MKNDKLYLATKIFAILGILLACYLLFEQITKTPSAICNISDKVNCDSMISGSVSKTLGIPTPLYGLVGYVIILFASIKKMPKLILGMATFGMVFCAWIGYQEIFKLNVICPLCLGCQTIMLVLFILSLILNTKRSDN